MFKKLLQLKTLLVAFLVMTGAGNVWGEQAILPKTQALTTEFANVGGDSNIQIKTSSANTYTNPLRIYANTTITIKAAKGYVINSVIYEASSTGNYVTNAQNAAVTPNVTPTVSGKNVTWTLSNVTEFTFKPSSQTRANSIVINYSASTSACATPTFSPAAGTYTSAQDVTISTTTDGATIYYTTDGTDPTTSSSSYSSAIPVSTTTTIKAIAVKEGMENSDVASATYTIVSLAHAGTEEDPYTVADARTAIDANVGKTGVYAKGIVSEIVTPYSSEYENITFDIVDENGTATLRAYRCSGTEAANVQVGDIVVVSGNLTKYNDIYEFAADNQLISLDRKEAAVLESIALSGTYPTTFTEGAAFSHEGMTVTATYSDESTKDVTNDASFSGYDMDTPGNQTVTVSYTEGDVKETATYNITVNAVPSHNVTWSVNGETIAESSYKEGASINFPEDPAAIKGKTFVGWVTTPITGVTDIAPSFVTSATMGDADVTYYAVFADLSTENSGWNKTPLDSITSTDVFVIAAGSYAMSNNGGTGKAPEATSITVADKKITSEVAEELKWNVSGNATDGYTFYPNGSTTTWLYCNTTASSSSNNNIRVGTGDRKFWVFNNSGYLVTKKDEYAARYLSLYNEQDFRGYTGTGNGAFVPKFYKYVGASYSAYCTAVIDAPTASVAACEFDTPFEVTIMSEEGTTLKYTTDGTDPAEGTAVATNSVVLSIPAETTRVRAIALLNGASSPELDVTYTYNSKQAPTLTVPASVDLKVNETGKTITVTTNSDGAVTFESSDDNHLLVDNDTDNKVGELLADAEGTYTVTVTVAETENFRSATAYVTVNVTDSNPIRSATFTFNGQYLYENIKNGITNSKVHFICGGDADRFAISTATDYKDQLAIYRKTDYTTNAGCFTISSTDDNYAIVRIELDGTNTGSLSTDVSSYDNSIWQGNSSSVTFTNNTTGTQCYISDITVLYARVTPLSVSSAGYATFSSTTALDFTNVEDINAYTATVSGDAISFTRVNKVPANTGLLLRSVNEGAVSTRVPLYDGATYDVTDNAFVAATEEIDHLPTTTTDGKYTNYILYKPSDGIIGFYKANGQKVGAGKAYLQVSSEQATRAYIAFSFDDPETGIAQIETLPQQGVAYDLQGRRVNAPKGGLYIINGKKVIVK